MDSAVQCSKVSYCYANGTQALLDVDLEIAAGEFAVVLGANGSGKSTLAKLIDALLAPSSGSVRVLGYDTRDADKTLAVREQVGIVFQNPDDQIVASIVEDDVAFGPENLGLPAEEIRHRVDDALGDVGLQELACLELASLSGGQKQLVALAGALAMHPRILVLDEPAAMLDPPRRNEVLSRVHELHAAGMTIVLVTQLVEDALGADRVIVLDSGRVVLDGPPEKVLLDCDALACAHVEEPFCARLAAALRARGICVSATLDEDQLKEELCHLYSNR